jgi:hypothetical protein
LVRIAPPYVAPTGIVGVSSGDERVEEILEVER